MGQRLDADGYRGPINKDIIMRSLDGSVFPIMEGKVCIGSIYSVQNILGVHKRATLEHLRPLSVTELRFIRDYVLGIDIRFPQMFFTIFLSLVSFPGCDPGATD